jgi:hypothetical protein
MSFPSFQDIQDGCLKGMISYRSGFSECEHGRASEGQHARKRFLTSLVALAKGKIHTNLETAGHRKSRVRNRMPVEFPIAASPYPVCTS